MKDGPVPDPAAIRGYPLLRLPAAPELGAEIDLRETLRRLARRKGTIVGITLLLTLATALVAFQLTPRYRADTKIMIEPRQSRVVNLEEVLSGLSGERETIESELRVISSRTLAEKVIARLRLAADPEFNPALRPPNPVLAYLNPLGWLPPDVRELLGIDRPTAPVPEEAILDNERARIVDEFLERLDVEPEGRSRIITVGFTSESPALAARVANTLSDLYLVEQLEAKFDATKRATEWLNERVAELRERVQTSERAVEDFRREAGLIEGKGFTVASQQVAELNSQLILARSQRAEAEARLRQVQSLLSGSGGVESAAEVLSSPLIHRLKEQEAEVLRRAADLASQYGPKHPRMINMRAEVDDLKGKIASEVRQIVQGLRNEVGVAQAREGSLISGLEGLKQNMGEANAAEVRLRALEREANANRSLFENFLSRLKETAAQENLQQADARIISRADVPEHASFPRKKLIIAAAGLIALLIAVAVAFLIEQLDPGFRSSEQIEAQLGVAGLGLVPLLGGIRMRPPEAYLLDRPASAFAESLRSLHTGLLLSNVDQPPRTVLVTSSVPREGKSTVALSMARLMARSGHKVLLVDADLRRPRVHAALRLQPSPGPVEVLARTATWTEAIQRDGDSGLDVLSAGENAISPPDLFSSAQMRSLLAELREQYDLVLLDSPPVLAVSEARILARLVDTTVFVVRWANTPREVAGLGIKQIRETGGHVAGAVLSMVNVRKNAQYRYGDSGYYYGPARRYYAN